MTGPELVSWFSPGYMASSGPERRTNVDSSSEIHNNHVELTGLTRDSGPKQACNQDLNQETSSGPVSGPEPRAIARRVSQRPACACF